MADPTLDAYLEALGFGQQKQLDWSQAAQQQGQVNAQYDLAVPDLMRQTALQQQGVQNDAVGRGIFGSGEQARNLGNVNTAAQQQLAHLNLSRDQGIQDIAMNLARQVAGLDIGQRTATYNWNQWDAANQAAQAALSGGNPEGDYYQSLLNQYQNGPAAQYTQPPGGQGLPYS